jgi:hypothetical protein
LLFRVCRTPIPIAPQWNRWYLRMHDPAFGRTDARAIWFPRSSEGDGHEKGKQASERQMRKERII